MAESLITGGEAWAYPEIPDDWSIENRNHFSIEWKGKNGIIGHESKYIAIESCMAEFEEDSYNLKPIDSIKRHMSIHTNYTRGRGKDSIFYYYQIEDSTRTISRKQADSVFDAEKIKKDY